MSDALERPEHGLVIAVSPGETRIAQIEDGFLVALTLSRRDRASRVGDVYRGRVTSVDQAIRGAFLDLGPAGPGFLGFEAGGAAVSEGERLLVQIRRDAENGKPIGVASRIELAGRLAVFVPHAAEIAVSRRLAPAQRRRLSEEAAALAEPGEGWQVRTAAAVAPPQALATEMAELRRSTAGWSSAGEPGLVHQEPGAIARALRETVDLELDQILVDERSGVAAAQNWCRTWRPELAEHVQLYAGPDDLFEALGLEAEIERGLARRLPLDGGGAITIDETRALTAIDVDRGGSPAHPADINEQAAMELVRQIRLRDIGGLVLVDFLRLRDRGDRDVLLQRLREEAEYDPLGLEVLGFTRAGLVELTRPRRRAGMTALMRLACPACEGSGRRAHPDAVALAAIRALLRESRHDPAARLVVVAAPEIVASLGGPCADALAEAGERLGRKIEMRADPTLPPDRYVLDRGA